MSSSSASGDFQVQPLEARVLLAAAPMLTIRLVPGALGRELHITGTPDNDSISLARTRQGKLRISNRSWSGLWSGAADAIVVSGLGGDDRIAINSNIWTGCVLYGNAGNDTLIGGTGKDRLFGGEGSNLLSGGAGDDVLVSVGGGRRDRNIGGPGLDSVWADANSSEIVTDLSQDEAAAGALHRIARFAGGEKLAPGDSRTDLELNGQKLSDPAFTGAASSYRSFASQPLFSTAGPSFDDIEQGQLGDCYLLSSLASVAKTNPRIIRQRIADLGDGTYAVQFTGGSSDTYVRVDGDLPTTSWGGLAYAQLGRQDSLWVAIVEKAYAFYRYGKADYGSLEGGFMSDVYNDLGLKSDSIFHADSGSDLLARLRQNLRDGKAVTFGTIDDVGTAPLIGGHAYVVDKVLTDTRGIPCSLRLWNPWAIDGAGHDGRDDGYVTLSAAQAGKVFWFACTAKV